MVRLKFLRERNISHKIFREKWNTHFTFNNFSPKCCRLWVNVERYGTARQTTDDNIMRRRPDVICMQGNEGKKHRHALRIFITNYCAVATMVMRTRLCCIIGTLHVSLNYLTIRWLSLCGTEPLKSEGHLLIDRGKPKPSEIRLSICLLVHHKFYLFPKDDWQAGYWTMVLLRHRHVNQHAWYAACILVHF
jgi:hypothetical protein